MSRKHRGRDKDLLTPLQSAVLLGHARGEQPGQIAAQLEIGVRDVRLHLRAVLLALKAVNATHAVGRACALGLLKSSDILEGERHAW
ncbi:LuxR C-terminal-related transcriptional regulator [Kitasatospora sp. NPDC086791]|uniref:LuxR C-terminal-related transcriptional regulator n=1 Tax=Kitasatospora sp. NPDC086791 TaxID=3155178 RepID=UPI003429B5D1